MSDPLSPYDWIPMDTEMIGVNLREVSIAVIRAGQAPNGAYVASPTFSQYGYSWLRDGAWIAHAMDLANEHDSARAFHRWAAQTLLRYEAQVERLLAKLLNQEFIDEKDYLPTRFTLDGALGQDEWTDFQLDGYGAWLWTLVQHCQTVTPDLWAEVRPAVQLTVRYLEALWQSPNYDCWEEHRECIHTATLGALYGGLAAVSLYDPEIAQPEIAAAIKSFVLENGVTEDGYFSKFIPPDPNTPGKLIDASLLWMAQPFELVKRTDPIFQNTLAAIAQHLHYPGGGVYRYLDDTYFGGGEWLLLAAWLGWVYAAENRLDEARSLRAWMSTQASPEGFLPEQVNHHMRDASYYQYWVDRWGTSASPLLWSHAMYLILDFAIQQKEALP